MFSKEESTNLKREFWIALGRYMSPVPSSWGENVNWMNYKTGIKDIFFRMKASGKSATVGIFLTHEDPDMQQLFFEQFEELKKILEDISVSEWLWRLHIKDENGNLISSITQELEGVSVLNKNDWPELISFYKQGIISLDEFWSVAQYQFDLLR